MFEHLFQPITVNGMILKNRIIATPTGDDYEEKALGGAALVIAGHAIVEPGRSSFASPNESYLFSKYEREHTRERVLRVHRGGARASIGIFHAGQDARTVDYAKGPTGFIRPDGVEVKEMDEAMMEETLKWYEETAAGAKKIGFDSIFLHFGHGWLPAQFLSPHYNHRTDIYGGCIENRSRFPLRILETVRQAVGRNYPIDMRISAYEWIENSISFEDVLYFLKEAQQYIDTVQISTGIDKIFEANVHCVTTNLEKEMPIPGVDNPKVLLATEAIDHPERLGQKAVILGGGSVGCEIALGLAEEGNDVSIIEMTGVLAGNANSLYQEALRQKFLLHDNITVYRNSVCQKIENENLIYTNAAGEDKSFSYDNLILATGLMPQIALTESFYGICRNTVAIGDCIRPSSIMEATYEAYVNALNI